MPEALQPISASRESDHPISELAAPSDGPHVKTSCGWAWRGCESKEPTKQRGTALQALPKNTGIVHLGASLDFVLVDQTCSHQDVTTSVKFLYGLIRPENLNRLNRFSFVPIISLEF